MNEEKDFSLEDSEDLINNLNSSTTPELEKLRSTLNLLSHVHELSPISTPPVLPSEIHQQVQLLTRKSSKSRHTVITSILTIGILASASLAAAAVTGRGPAPIVSAGHESAKFVKAVAGAVSKAVTGKSSGSPSTPTLPTRAGEDKEEDKGKNKGDDKGGNSGGGAEGSLNGPSALPTSESDDQSDESNSGSDDDGKSIVIAPTPKPETTQKKDEKDHSSHEGSRSTTAKPSPEPTPTKTFGVPKPTSSPDDNSSDDEEDD